MTLGCSGVILEDGSVLCPLGAVLKDWPEPAVEVEGYAATVGGHFSFADVAFVLLHCVKPLAMDREAESEGRLRVQQYGLHLTQPHWGVLTQEAKVVLRPQNGVVLVDVSCYEGGEGGLVSGGGEEPRILAKGLIADGAPTGLSIAISIAAILGTVETIMPSSSPQIRSNNAVHVVQSSTGQWGTGFSVGGGKVVTAGHVVCRSDENAPSTVTVRCGGNSWNSAKVLHCWPGGWLDVCVLQLPQSVESLELSDSAARVGNRVSLISATPNNGLQMTTEGSLMTVVDPAQLVSNVVAWSGSSGGPLIGADGKVVGLLVSTASRGKIRIPRLSLFLPVALWRCFLIDGPVEPIDDATRAIVEPVWRLALPPLPPKFDAFLKSRL